MPSRPWFVLIDEARQTGTFDSYEGDGATVPYQINGRYVLRYLTGFDLLHYKAYLDANYPLAFQLHDWCYTPYGQLIGVGRDEADRALQEMIHRRVGPGEDPRDVITPESIIDATLVYACVATTAGPYFSVSQTGFDPAVFAAASQGAASLPDLVNAAASLAQFQAINAAIWESVAMPIYKYTVGLQRIAGKPTAGFTETWYFNEGSDEAARNAVADYVSERAKILSRSWQVGTFARLSVLSANCKRFKPEGRTKFCCVPKIEARVQCVCPAPLTGKLLVDADQNWDGLLIELCTDSILHTGCAKCSPLTKPFVRNWIMRGIPDTWYSGGEPAISAADKAKVQTFINYLLTAPTFGSVGCSDACSDDDTTSCTSVVFAPFVHACPRYDQIHKRNTGRPFGLGRGRRSRRRTV